MLIFIACFIGVFLAYANGANDNFKGVATLYGSGTATYRTALGWATFTTVLGSATAVVLAHGLIATFMGKGLVPDAVVAMKSFGIAASLAAALTVMLATQLGFPISTTHALTGGLVGAGLLASAGGVSWAKLGTSFFLPLLVSPLLSIALAAIVYPLFRLGRVRSGVGKETCVCVGTEIVGVVPAGVGRTEAIAMFSSGTPSVTVASEAVCVERYQGNVLGISAAGALDKLHFLSAGAVCFARAVNDTPKIAAILLAAAALPPSIAITLVAALMAAGGLLQSRRIAGTMSLKVTDMNPGQGFTANLVTSFLVIFASKLGMPVSTTHVSCGSLFGIGAVTKQAHWKTILSILTAWVTTLPIAAALGALSFLALRQIIG